MATYYMMHPDEVQNSRYLSELVEKMKSRRMDAEIDSVVDAHDLDFEHGDFPYGSIAIVISPCHAFTAEEKSVENIDRTSNAAYEYAMEMF